MSSGVEGSGPFGPINESARVGALEVACRALRGELDETRSALEAARERGGTVPVEAQRRAAAEAEARCRALELDLHEARGGMEAARSEAARLEAEKGSLLDRLEAQVLPSLHTRP